VHDLDAEFRDRPPGELEVARAEPPPGKLDDLEAELTEAIEEDPVARAPMTSSNSSFGRCRARSQTCRGPPPGLVVTTSSRTRIGPFAIVGLHSTHFVSLSSENVPLTVQ
jgi:hypothetical protein